MRTLFFSIFYISLTVFLWPLLQEHDEISLLDFGYATSIFIIVIMIEFFIFFLAKALLTLLKNMFKANVFIAIISEKLTTILIASIISVNFYYFFLTLINIPRETRQYIGILLVPLIYFIFINKNRLRFTLLFCTIFILISLAKLTFSLTTGKQDNLEIEWDLEKFQHLYNLKEKADKRNIYLISFDSAVSPESLRTLFRLAIPTTIFPMMI